MSCGLRQVVSSFCASVSSSVKRGQHQDPRPGAVGKTGSSTSPVPGPHRPLALASSRVIKTVVPRTASSTGRAGTRRLRAPPTGRPGAWGPAASQPPGIFFHSRCPPLHSPCPDALCSQPCSWKGALTLSTGPGPARGTAGLQELSGANAWVSNKRARDAVAADGRRSVHQVPCSS